jgi:hypothetical protein
MRSAVSAAGMFQSESALGKYFVYGSYIITKYVNIAHFLVFSARF